jgi:hypothetical protein
MAKKKREIKEEPGYSFTAEEIVDARDFQGMSWAQVAEHFNLFGPSGKPYFRAAKRAYADLTGTDYASLGSTNGKAGAPRASKKNRTRSINWNDDTDQDEIEQALLGECTLKDGKERWKPVVLTVRRDVFGEPDHVEIPCRYASAFSYGPNGLQPLQVEIVEHLENKGFQGTSIRTLFVHKIEEITR